jgi:hypothetical protein
MEESVLRLNKGTQRLGPTQKSDPQTSPHLNASYASSITLTIPTERNGGTIAIVVGENMATRQERLVLVSA